MERALNVIKQKNEWILYLQNIDTSDGILYLDSKMMHDIKDAIYLDNSIHSSTSLALCLQECIKFLKIDVKKNENSFRIFH